MKNSQTYWATLPEDQISSAMDEKFDDYLHTLESSGMAQRIQKSYSTYYGTDQEGAGGFGIEMKDEAISGIGVNHYKSLLVRLHGLVTQAKLSFDVIATNSDSKSLLQADFTKDLLDAETTRAMGSMTEKLAENSIVLYGGYIYAPWNRFGGDPITAGNNGQTIFSGEQKYHVLNFFDVARSTSEKESPWYIIETKENRWELAACYPDKVQEILNAGSGDEVNPRQLSTPFNRSGMLGEDDTVLVRTLIHRKTKALKSGRMTVCVGNVVLSDEALSYRTLPIVEMKAGEILGTVFGDSPASSLVALQEALNRIYSANLTNVLNGAVSNIYCSDPNISIATIAPGQNVITASAPPIAVALTGVSPDAINLVNDLINQSTLLSGLNNTAKGNPESSLKSGTSLSLMLSTAIQFSQGMQRNYAAATAELATIFIHNLQAFSKGEKLAATAGIANAQMAQDFTAKDLIGIDRIVVQLGNPLTQTYAGRQETVQMLMSAGIIKDINGLDEFLRTGNFEALTEDQWAEATLIREENEMLRRGQKPVVLLTDNHPRHITEALTVLNSQNARNDPLVTQAVLAHVQEHIEMMKQVPPDLAAILGLQPLPSQQAPQGPPPGPSDQPSPNVNGTSLPTGKDIPPELAGGYEEYTQNISANPAANLQE